MWFWKKKYLADEQSIDITPDLRDWLCQAPALMLIRQLELNIQSLRVEIGDNLYLTEIDLDIKRGKIKAYTELIGKIKDIRKPKEAVNGKQ